MLKLLKKLFNPKGVHKHKCPKCRAVWQHDPGKKLSETAHNCPECGRKRQFVYSGSDSAKYIQE